MLRRSEREELSDLKGSDTERAIVARDGGVCKEPFELSLSVFQESFVWDTRWEGMGILGINLRLDDENGAEMLNRALRTWGMFFGSVRPAGYTLCYKYRSGN